MIKFIKGLFTPKTKKPPFKTECTIQFEGAECGAASLSTILKYYGKYVPLSELRETTSVSRDGANAKYIVEAAEFYGLNATPVKANMMYLKALATYPAIAFWGFNHFLVLEGFDDTHAYVADPARGRYRINMDYFRKKFTGVLIELRPGENFKKGGKKEINLTTVLSIIAPYKSLILTFILLTILGAIPTLTIAGAIGIFTDTILLSGKIDLAVPTFWVVVFSTVLAITLQFISQVLDRRLTYIMTKDLAAQAFQKLHTVPMQFLESRSDGELAQRALLAIRIPQLISSSLIKFVANFIVAASVLLIVFFISKSIGLIFLVGFIFNISMIYFLTKDRLDLNVSYAIAEAEANSITLEGLSSIEVLKSCGLEFDFIERWIHKYIEQINQSQNLLRDTAKTSVVGNITRFVFTAAVLIVGAFLIFFTNQLSVGSIISLQFLTAMITIPFMQIPSVLYSLQRLDGQLGRYNDLMNNEDDNYVVPLLAFNRSVLPRASLANIPDENIPNFNDRCILELSNIKLKFSPKLPYVLDNLNLTFDHSNHLALVGGSGSGKSTILKIIAGLIEPTEGDYFINKIKWERKYTNSIRKKIGYVPQFPALFNGTMRENLLMYNNLSISDEEIVNASRITGADKIIFSNSEGLDYALRDNASNLSGGQKQLLEITRVILRKPDILLLDESTAALDEKTEEFLLNNLWQTGIRTTSACHRLKSALLGDCIAYIQNGTVSEIGSPNQLTADPSSLFTQLLNKESN